MGDWRRQLGQAGEDLAARFLARHGYVLIGRNVRVPGGEIDIVARDRGCLVFVEVRTRQTASFGTPEESITAAKARRLVRLVDAFREVHAGDRLPDDSRIDVVAVEVDADGQPVRIDLIKNAVEGE